MLREIQRIAGTSERESRATHQRIRVTPDPVPELSGSWKDLLEKVNLLSDALTSHRKAISQVTTAVAQGDLIESIGEAPLEVAKLKRSINEMILDFKETVQKNSEQDWLKSNLARLAGLLQGHRDLFTLAQLILSELALLLNVRHGTSQLLASVSTVLHNRVPPEGAQSADRGRTPSAAANKRSPGTEKRISAGQRCRQFKGAVRAAYRSWSLPALQATAGTG
jgi:hypothetical protein